MTDASITPEIRADYRDAIPLARYGLEEELAGVTHRCEIPPELGDPPVLTRRGPGDPVDVLVVTPFKLPPGVVINTSPVKQPKPTPTNNNTANNTNYSNNNYANTSKGPRSPAYDTNTEFSPSSVVSDPFAPLESAIQEASKHALQQAKLHEKSDPKLAVVHMREYKALQQDMVVLQSRRATPGAGPALFHWAVSMCMFYFGVAVAVFVVFVVSVILLKLL